MDKVRVRVHSFYLYSMVKTESGLFRSDWKWLEFMWRKSLECCNFGIEIICVTLLLPDADQTDADGTAASDDDDLGGLFKVVNKEQPGGRRQSSSVQGGLNDRDCSFFPVEGVRDWSLEEVRITTCVLLLCRW